MVQSINVVLSSHCVWFLSRFTWGKWNDKTLTMKVNLNEVKHRGHRKSNKGNMLNRSSVCLLCFSTISSPLPNFYNRKVLHWRAERRTVKKWKAESRWGESTKKKKIADRFSDLERDLFEGFEESNLTSNYPVTRSVPPSKSHQGLHEFSDCLPQAFPGVRKRRWVRSKAGGGQANSKPCTWQGFLCTGHKMTPFPQRPLAAGASARLILSQRSLLGWR